MTINDVLKPWRLRTLDFRLSTLGSFVWATLIILVGSLPAAAEEPDDDFGAELPRIAPVEPDRALTTFQVQQGYHLELVAAEPLVNDPVAAAFDENGQLYVVEMRGYSEQPDELLSRVRLLKDTDGDGRFDESVVFVDQLSWPTAVACYDGGVFIGDAPDILYCKDTNGDGCADERKTVFTGFSKANVQGLLNSFCWGLDNRIHGATSTSGGSVRRADEPLAKPVNLNGRDFAFDPRTLELMATSGGAQHGMSFDAWGRKFDCSNSDHIQQVMYDDRYVARNPYLSAPAARRSIAADGPQAEVFRTSPVEPWRIVRTRLRVSGAVPGPIEGGGRAAGYFTGATGVTIYKGDAWKTSDELAIVGDVGSNLVHRKRLERNGLEFIARRIDERSEFVSSRDIWFRPAQFLNVPDGTLYILDVYREVIEHPASLPPIIKRHLDLTSGRDRGRIYRIAPEGFHFRKAPSLGGAATSELVALLEHANSWHRDTASRLLYERQDVTAVPLLEKLAKESPSPLGRMHALYALAGLKSLSAPALLAALSNEHAGVREHAVKLSESLLNTSDECADRVIALVDDDDLRVRYQLAFSLGELKVPRRIAALAALARRDAGDRWMRLAIQSSLGEGADQILAQLAADGAFRQTDAGMVFFDSLARQIGAANRAAELQAALTTVEKLAPRDDAAAGAIVRGLAAGLAQRGAKLETALSGEHAAAARRLIGQLLKSARATAADETKAAGRRVAAIDTLALANFGDIEECLSGLVSQRQPQEVQRAALRTLGRFSEASVATIVLGAFPGLGPAVRGAASDVLFSRPAWIGALFDAVEDGEISAGDLDPTRLKLLAAHPDMAIRKRAEKLFASLAIGRRQDVVEAYRDVLTMPGEAERGKAAFKKVCAACHRVEGVGQELGPNLATVKSRGADAILVNLLDPSREVNPQFVNYVLTTDDGRTLTGMIAAETATSVTLRRAEGAGDTVLRVNIEELRGTGQSLMPDGMEKQLSKQDIADLIAYLLNAN